jgi:hypothetical protein
MRNNLYPYVFFTCVTSDVSYLLNIISNFERQKYINKELCIIFNKKNKVKINCNYKILYLPGRTINECLNESIKIIPKNCYIWANMIDKDYYDDGYLLTSIFDMLKNNCDIVGKKDYYSYIPKERKLYYVKNGGHKKFTNHIELSSLVIKKYVFNNILFSNNFFKDIIKNNYNIYASSVDDYIKINNKLNNNFINIGSKKTIIFENKFITSTIPHNLAQQNL